MTFLFVLTGLWAIRVSVALALAPLAGLAQFVPLIGLPIAPCEGWQTARWPLLLQIAIQQVETNISTPLGQRQTASLPRDHPVRGGREVGAGARPA